MTKRKILQDHKQQGKSLIPPFKYMLGSLQEFSWVKTMLPELLWIALIQDYYGHCKGVELITLLAQSARKCSYAGGNRIFATISTFGEMSTTEQANLQNELVVSGGLFEIQKALFPLIAFYPECPLRFLYSTQPNYNGEVEQNIKRFRILIEAMYDRTCRDTVLVQATVIWLAFDAEILKVHEGLSLARFPEIDKYPDTELSQNIAASIRSSIYMFFNEAYYPISSSWPTYFWNHGLKIDRCYFKE